MNGFFWARSGGHLCETPLLCCEAADAGWGRSHLKANRAGGLVVPFQGASLLGLFHLLIMCWLPTERVIPENQQKQQWLLQPSLRSSTPSLLQYCVAHTGQP